MKLQSRQQKIFIIILIFICLATFLRWQNNSIVINEIDFIHNKIPKEFDGYRILQISDLHNKEFGPKQSTILSKIQEINPDIIIITGDLIDSNNTDINIAMDLIRESIKIAPIFYVSGNHESWSGYYEKLKSQLERSGVTVLDNKQVQLSKCNTFIDIVGLSDPSFIQSDSLEYDNSTYMKDRLSNIISENENFKILLSHRPELFDIYASSNVDLVFSGHAHGGQFRIPFIGGLIAPDQGLFPKLTEGIHIKNNTSMIVSRGLGNSIIPIRIFNRPELILIKLSK